MIQYNTIRLKEHLLWAACRPFPQDLLERPRIGNYRKKAPFADPRFAKHRIAPERRPAGGLCPAL